MPPMPLHVIRDAPLARLNTFGVEASARRLVELADAAATDDALEAVAGAGPVLVLGGGSNVLFAGDFDGTVLRVGTRGCRVAGEDAGTPVVEARAGEDWDGFVRWTLAQGLFGLENLALIPGTVGASPIQNIGAYGVEMRERFHGLSAVRLTDGARRDFDAPACAFGYRDSVFKHADGAGWLVTDVRFRLSREPAPRTGYADLRDELARRSIASATPADVADAVSAIRRRKLPDPARLGNAGSFFKNPVVAADRAADLVRRHPALPARTA